MKEWCAQTSKPTSGWPSALRVDSIVILPNVERLHELTRWSWTIPVSTESTVCLEMDVLWPRTNINPDLSTGPLARPFARSLAPLTSLSPSLVGK